MRNIYLAFGLYPFSSTEVVKPYFLSKENDKDVFCYINVTLVCSQRCQLVARSQPQD